jgi:molybdate transport system substrate-binding protein
MAPIAKFVSVATFAAALLLAAAPVRAGDALVFAAASTTEALDEAVAAFAAAGGGSVRGVFAGSSLLAKQIENGAPADLYLSANPAWMDYLAERGHIAVPSRRDLLANRLVVIAPADDAGGALDVETDLLAALGEGRLAMGDPDHVPVGIYAREALAAMGLWAALEDRLIRAADVRVALHMVARGEAPLGIVYASDAAAFGGVRVVGEIDPALHAPIRYPIALVAGREVETARRFLDFLFTPEMAALFRRHGFELP